MTVDVTLSKSGAVGRLRLDRPKQLNALTTGMCTAMLGALDEWASDPSVAVVIIDHLDGRGFCAGGDIKMLSRSGAADGVAAREFFTVEYRLNNRLFHYAKPTIAFMDGVTMGGGVGISQPCRFRVATENTRFAMPETAIGLFPDVGGGWYLSRLPGRMGQYIGLTGRRLDGADMISLGLATHYVPSARLEEAKAGLIDASGGFDDILAAFAVQPPAPAIAERRAEIDRLFAPDDLGEILRNLRDDDGDFARESLTLLGTMSPQSMRITLRLLRDGATRTSFEEEMAVEYVLASRLVGDHDFLEGVRALLIDRDNHPVWRAPEPGGAGDRLIDAFFDPLPETEAWTPA
jgi:enoyl-CoA hydratase